jgi:hypothetical protein
LRTKNIKTKKICSSKCEEFLRNLRTKKYKNEKDLLIKMRRNSSQLEKSDCSLSQSVI